MEHRPAQAGDDAHCGQRRHAAGRSAGLSPPPKRRTACRRRPLKGATPAARQSRFRGVSRTARGPSSTGLLLCVATRRERALT
ncbi:MAG: hypothetical protein EOP81_09740 [Variovorax sp.]|nr:MAG: hypothetical protein EOP81_09740 [Variovorax sp.]